MTEERYNIYLGGTCEHQETGKKDYFSVPFSFKNTHLFDMHDGTLFDTLIAEFNDWLQGHGYEKWCLDECAQPDREFQDEKEVDCVMIDV